MADVIQTWKVVGEDAVLLGAALAIERSERRVSLDGSAFASRRTEGWFSAIERGDVGLTREMAVVYVSALTGASPSAAQGIVDVDELREAVRKEPFGRRSLDLRRSIGLRRTTSAHEAADLEVTDMVGGQDRLLVLQPWLLLAAAVAAVLTVTQLAVSGTIGWVEQAQTALLPIGLLGTAIAAVEIRAADRILDKISRPFRTGEYDIRRGRIEDLLRPNGIDWAPAERWRFDGVEPYLLPKYRSVLRARVCRMLIAQRSIGAIAIGSLASVAATATVFITSNSKADAISPMILTLALFAALMAFWNEAGVAAVDVHGAIACGLGYRFEEQRSTFRSRRVGKKSEVQ